MSGPARFALVLLLVLGCGCERLRRLGQRVTPATPSASVMASAQAAPAASVAAPSNSPAPESAEAPSEVPVPKGFVRMTVSGVAPTPQGNAVLLVDDQQKRAIPIIVGETEALSIRLRLAKRRYPRPLTHDLMDSALVELGANVQYVRVDKLEDNVFIGTVVVRQGARQIELDARSSDAVALALGKGVPIFVAKKVVEFTAVDLDRIQQPSEREGEPPVGPDPHRAEPVML